VIEQMAELDEQLACGDVGPPTAEQRSEWHGIWESMKAAEEQFDRVWSEAIAFIKRAETDRETD
jgi:hypothetical protein